MVKHSTKCSSFLLCFWRTRPLSLCLSILSLGKLRLYDCMAGKYLFSTTLKVHFFYLILLSRNCQYIEFFIKINFLQILKSFFHLIPKSLVLVKKNKILFILISFVYYFFLALLDTFRFFFFLDILQLHKDLTCCGIFII